MNTDATPAPAPLTMTELFGDVIHSYSRAQAIEDGVLVDVTETASEAGFRFPVALTRAVFDAYVTIPAGVRLQDEAGRLWDILSMGRFAIQRSRTGGTDLLFGVHVRNDNRDRTPPLRTLKLVCGPGDTAEPVITIMMRDED